jgi:glutathione-independent formaldehyde dehydrogenase
MMPGAGRLFEILPNAMQMGLENTGEVVEVGSHVAHIKKGDWVSVPFNVACGTCRNCKERHTDVCLRANEDRGFCGAYGFNLGGWQGQADYMLVPWADFQLLRFPDKDQALEKIRGSPAARTPQPGWVPVIEV